MAEKRQKVDLLIPDGAEKIKTPAGEFVKEILKKYGYESINMCRDGFVTTMEISWDN